MHHSGLNDPWRLQIWINLLEDFPEMHEPEECGSEQVALQVGTQGFQCLEQVVAMVLNRRLMLALAPRPHSAGEADVLLFGQDCTATHLQKIDAPAKDEDVSTK